MSKAISARHTMLRCFTKALLSALSFSHARGIAHCSLGLGSCFINGWEERDPSRLLLKLDNWGLAQVYPRAFEGEMPGEGGGWGGGERRGVAEGCVGGRGGGEAVQEEGVAEEEGREEGGGSGGGWRGGMGEEGGGEEGVGVKEMGGGESRGLGGGVESERGWGGGGGSGAKEGNWAEGGRLGKPDCDGIREELKIERAGLDRWGGGDRWWGERGKERQGVH